jgi:hypothetical protein
MRSFGSGPFRGATRRAAPSLQSRGIVRINFRTVPYICALHAQAASTSPESSCCIESIVVFTPTPPRTAAFWVWGEVLANYRGKNALAAGSAFACPAHLKTASGSHWINQLRLGAAPSNFEPAYSSDALAQTRGSLLTGNVAVNRTVFWPESSTNDAFVCRRADPSAARSLEQDFLIG